jgi:hypothetical protein
LNGSEYVDSDHLRVDRWDPGAGTKASGFVHRVLASAFVSPTS